MNRDQKRQEVEKLKTRFQKARLAVLTDFKGLKVSELTELRTKLREKESVLQVVKNRLAKIALKDTELAFLTKYLTGTTVLTTTDKDPTGPAKVLTEFAKDHEQIVFKGASMVGKEVDYKTVTAIAKLPGREELLAKLMGSMMAPARNWVTVLSQIPRQVINVLAAVRDKKEKESK